MDRADIIKGFEPKRENVLHILHSIQNNSGTNSLSEDDLKAVAKHVGISRSEIMGISTFYTMFSLSKRGKYVIRVCASPHCNMVGSDNVLNILKTKLSIEVNETTKDNLFTLETASCLGLCGFGPAMMINDKPFVSLTDKNIGEILDSYKKNGNADSIAFDSKKAKEVSKMKQDKQVKVVLDSVEEIDPLSLGDYKAKGGFEGLKKALSMKNTEVVDEVKKSGLRGRGGAGFPTGLKWSFTAPLSGDKYILCNADEGEPGTFKDRIIMEGVPMRLLEGIIIAGYAVGAKKGYIYIRGEYAKSIEILEKAIAILKKEKFLGEKINGSNFSFDIEIRKGAGAYVCGDETALIESMEGKRGNPRNKPPFPGVKGYNQNPSVVNNVETLANVPAIMFKGADWFKKMGTEKSSGTKIFLLSGNVANPGPVEVPFGITLKELINTYGGGVKGGKAFKGALLGGAAGSFVSKDVLDTAMDYDSLAAKGATLGSGAILVFTEEDDLLKLIKSVMKFFSHESCGKCSPCRIGTKHLEKLAEKMYEGKATKADWEKMKKLAKDMKLTSFCPLGQSLIIPIGSLEKFFDSDVTKKIGK